MSVPEIARLLKLVVSIASHHTAYILITIHSLHIYLVAIPSTVSIAALATISLVDLLVNHLIFASFDCLFNKGLSDEEALILYGIQRRLLKLKEVRY